MRHPPLRGATQRRLAAAPHACMLLCRMLFAYHQPQRSEGRLSTRMLVVQGQTQVEQLASTWVHHVHTCNLWEVVMHMLHALLPHFLRYIPRAELHHFRVEQSRLMRAQSGIR